MVTRTLHEGVFKPSHYGCARNIQFTVNATFVRQFYTL
jgi:hypothetical protein